MQNSVLQLDPRDNVLVALTPLRKGERIPFSGDTYTLLSDIPAKHKFVTKDLRPGEQIIMYGGLVGTMSEPMRRGDLLSTQNLRHAASDYHLERCAAAGRRRMFRRGASARFLGITAPMGKLGREIIGWSFRWCFARTAILAF